MSWTHLEDVTVKSARKPHRCYLCAETIEVGETYVRRVGADEDGINVAAMHPECEEVSQSWSIDDWESFWEGELERPKKGGGA